MGMKSNYFAWLLISATLLAQSKAVPQNSALAATASAHPADPTGVLKTYGKLPLSFEPNLGQVDAQVKFLSRGSGYALFLTRQEAVLSFRQQDSQQESKTSAGRESTADAVLHMRLVDAHPDALITGVDDLPGKTNYIRGNDPKKWTTNVANFAKVRYQKVFDGVDLVYYGNQGQ